jgi:ADP-heptose:LPS heptosyltransferase
MNKCCAYFKSGIGNFIVATPALQLLAKYDDREQIDVIFDKFWNHDPRIIPLKNIIENCFFIDKLILAPCENFDPYAYSLCYMTVQSETSKLAKSIRKKIAAPIIWPNDFWSVSCAHEADVNLSNLRIILDKEKKIALDDEIFVPPLHCPKADTPIIEDVPRPIIGICNSYQKEAIIMQKKSYPHFPQLVDLLKKKFKKCTIVGIGGGNELLDCSLDIDYTGKLKMIETSKAISQLDFFITTDTGNMHIGDAHKIPGIVLFGGTLISKNGPINGTLEPIRIDVSCSPCQGSNLFYTCKTPGCMEDLSPEIILEKMEEWL